MVKQQELYQLMFISIFCIINEFIVIVIFSIKCYKNRLLTIFQALEAGGILRCIP